MGIGALERLELNRFGARRSARVWPGVMLSRERPEQPSSRQTMQLHWQPQDDLLKPRRRNYLARDGLRPSVASQTSQTASTDGENFRHLRHRTREGLKCTMAA